METIKTELVVIGAGPGGYAAAFYGADRGKQVILIDKDARLGGVCLNRGCIPSKALLHATHQIEAARESKHRGIVFDPPTIDLDALRDWKESVIDKLAGGVAGLAKARDVTVVRGRASFENSNTLRVESDEGQQYIEYDHAILAVGSHPAVPSAWDLGNPRIMTSTEALEIEDIPETLLIVGGGYIGMELGTVYAGLGSKIVMVEALDSILMGADADLKRPVLKRAESMFESVRLKTKVESMSTSGKQIKVAMTFGDERVEELYDRVLIAVGRRPNTEDLGLDATKIALDERGYVKVNDQQRTDDESIYAIGDVAGGILLAHKASKEARIAIDAIFGEEPGTRDYIIPAVVFTDPEIAWCGVTESEAKEKGLNVEVSRFPWSGSGRALSFDRTEGLTKLVIDKDTERILGVGIVGVGAGELIGEGVLAVEMGATALDLAETVHAHPTVAETLMESAELFYGHATHRIGRKARS